MVGVLPYPGRDTTIVKSHEDGDVIIVAKQLFIQQASRDILVQFEQSLSADLEALVVGDPPVTVMNQPDFQVGFHWSIWEAGTSRPGRPG